MPACLHSKADEALVQSLIFLSVYPGCPSLLTPCTLKRSYLSFKHADSGVSPIGREKAFFNHGAKELFDTVGVCFVQLRPTTLIFWIFFGCKVNNHDSFPE